jgi:hypothetical protein
VKESSGSAIFNLTIFHRSAKLECACLAWLPRVVTTNDIHESAKIFNTFVNPTLYGSGREIPNFFQPRDWRQSPDKEYEAGRF